MRRLASLALTACAALAAALPATAGAQARERWNTRVLALVPLPGFPAMAYVHPNGRIYAGTYENPNGDTMASKVFEYDGAGTLLRSWTVEGQDLSQPHGVQVATSDGGGHLVLLEKSTRRAILLNTVNGAQTTYAQFPDGSTPNYAAWGPDGSLYVTDYTQPVLWRVPPGGGKPVEWLRDARFDGAGQFGMTGLSFMADRRTLMVGMQSQAGGGAGNPSTGRLWTVPIQPDGRPGELKQFWESRPADGPDGFAIARSGAVYVALLVANQIAVLSPQGTELERFPSSPGGANGSSVPFDSPSSAKFLGTRIIVAQQSYFMGDRTRQGLLDVETNEAGLPELLPPAPVSQSATKPNAKKKVKGKARKRCTKKQRRKHPKRCRVHKKTKKG